MKPYFNNFLRIVESGVVDNAQSGSAQPSNNISNSFTLAPDVIFAFFLGVGITLFLTILIYFMVKDFKKNKNKNKKDAENTENKK